MRRNRIRSAVAFGARLKHRPANAACPPDPRTAGEPGRFTHAFSTQLRHRGREIATTCNARPWLVTGWSHRWIGQRGEQGSRGGQSSGVGRSAPMVPAAPAPSQTEPPPACFRAPGRSAALRCRALGGARPGQGPEPAEPTQTGESMGLDRQILKPRPSVKRPQVGRHTRWSRNRRRGRPHRRRRPGQRRAGASTALKAARI